MLDITVFTETISSYSVGWVAGWLLRLEFNPAVITLLFTDTVPIWETQ